ncbi:MAG TPA: glycoside hydrolase family 44 protein, partial [Xanthomonadales bacterium]|nr:glycoside hydrolase family 44 protein [Xanthomonadales bacterium]
MLRSFAAFALLAATSPLAAAPLVFYADAPRAGLNDYSWATHTLANASPVHAGSFSIRFEPDFYGGIYLVDENTPYRFADYAALRFWVHGGTTGGQRLQLFLTRSGLNVAELDVAQFATVTAGQWREVVVPFDATTTLTHGVFDGFMLMDYSGNNQAAVYVDDISFDERTTPLASAPLSATVNVAAVLRPVNPEVYGVNFGDDAQHADLRFPVRRSGGNSTTRYNWQSDSHNTASDYFYQNIADGSGSGLPNNSTANAFVASTRANGGQAIVTMPLVGWVPIGDRVKRWGYSILKYGPQDQNECSIYNPVPPWCSADAGNGLCANVSNTTGFCVNGRIVGNDPTDTSIAVTPAWATGWTNHLVARHGLAANGGVRYYSLDNEVMLWNSTHRDVHPVPPGYDEIWQRGRDYAAAIKQADPGAKVLGPVT